MKAKLLCLLIVVAITGCGKKTWQKVDTDNPAFHPNVVFREYEDLRSPKFRQLVEKYQLDTVFHGETDEFRRILLLRHWIKSVITINDFGDPYPGDGDVEAILDEALQGQGYHCGHFMIVQNAIMNAYGYVTRTLGAGPGVKGGPDGHHGINEIWLNQYNKWFLSDAKYDHHFEKNGIPLSALEIRDEFLKNKAADIIKVKGPERKPFDIDEETGYSKEKNAQTYTWIEWHAYTNPFTRYPESRDLLIMFQDEYFRNNTWIWGDKPHWAYSQTEYLQLVQDRDQLYWTPNTLSSDVMIDGKQAVIELTSDTPNLQEYQVRMLPSGEWTATQNPFTLTLKKKKYELLFRVVNMAGVPGPEHKVIIERR